jgi:hypothetical protein
MADPSAADRIAHWADFSSLSSSGQPQQYKLKAWEYTHAGVLHWEAWRVINYLFEHVKKLRPSRELHNLLPDLIAFLTACGLDPKLNCLPSKLSEARRVESGEHAISEDIAVFIRSEACVSSAAMTLLLLQQVAVKRRLAQKERARNLLVAFLSPWLNGDGMQDLDLTALFASAHGCADVFTWRCLRTCGPRFRDAGERPDICV